jgi:hypothetical protein
MLLRILYIYLRVIFDIIKCVLFKILWNILNSFQRDLMKYLDVERALLPTDLERKQTECLKQ